jgi:hypothetical protein
MVFFFRALSFLVESFGLLIDPFPFPSILDAGYPVFDLHLADFLFDVINIPGATKTGSVLTSYPAPPFSFLFSYFLTPQFSS